MSENLEYLPICFSNVIIYYQYLLGYNKSFSVSKALAPDASEGNWKQIFSFQGKFSIKSQLNECTVRTKIQLALAYIS